MDPRAGVVFATMALAACGDSDPSPPPARPYADPGFVEAGGMRMHYALTPTLDLPSAIAGSYGVVQKPNLALLTVTLAPQVAAGAPQADAYSVAATAVTLTGIRTPLALRRVHERGAATWLATLAVRHREPVTIEIRARHADGAEIAARWTREFHVE